MTDDEQNPACCLFINKTSRYFNTYLPTRLSITIMLSCNDHLLETWPHCRPPPSLKRKANSSRRPAAKSFKESHQVRFSEASQLHLYERPSISLLQSLSYSSDDRDKFGMEAILEGNRIKNLIASAAPESAAESLKFLLKENIIALDELIGIDNFVMGKSSRVTKIRKRHSAAVLRKQREVRLQAQTLQEDAALILGRFAEQSSHKSTQNALVRAAISA